MILDLNKIYQYVFNDWADIDKAIKKDLDESLKTTRRIKKKAEIKKFFFEAADEKSHPLITEQNKAQFRALLRELKSKHLEQVLFDNVTDELEESYPFPDDEQIEACFDEQEKVYHYFSQTKEDTAVAVSRFKKYFKVCKLVGDLIEHNNSVSNSAAIKHAYKLLVVFGNKPANDFQPIDEYLNTYNFYKLNAPLHDALINSIPKCEDKAFHLPEWRKLIQQSGPRGFQLFDLAAAVEKQLQKAPASYVEALEAAKKMTYKNADHYPELADLCFQYRRSEEIFEKCLAVEKKRKVKDNLPIISVNGADIEKPDYHLVKLPIHDPRAYLLGHITNCCQSIGGHSEECVIDGMTRENNGFYVLLRANKTNVQTKPCDEKGNIDYHSFDIVGQGYAWISEQHNLTFDSWENLTPSRDDEVIAKMLKQFGKQLTHANGSPFLRVTIGTGGKTPEILENNITTPEVMREGTMYGDASKQSEIYCNEEKRGSLLAGLEIDKYLACPSIELLKSWIAKSCYSADYFAKTKQILSTNQISGFLSHLLAIESQFKTVSKTPWSRLVSLYTDGVFTKLSELKLENEQEAIQLIILNDRSTAANLQAISVLENYKMGTKNELVLRVLNYPRYATEFCDAYIKLKELKLENDLELWNYILSTIHIAGMVGNVVSLAKINLANDKEIRNAVFCFPDRASIICNAFALLSAFQLERDEVARFRILSDYGLKKYDYIKDVFSELEKLKEMNVETAKKNVIAKSIVDFANIVTTILPVYKKLCEYKLENVPELFESLFKYCPKEEYIHSYVKLCELKLENDPDIKQCILKGYIQYSAFAEAFALIKQYGWEADTELRQCICDKPSLSLIAVNSLSELLKLDLDEFQSIREYLFKHPREPLIDLMSQLKELKLENDLKLRKLLFKYVGMDKWEMLLKLKQINLENDIDICEQSINKPDLPNELIYRSNQLEKMKLEKDPDIRKRIISLTVEGKYHSVSNLLFRLSQLRDNQIPITDHVKNKLLTQDYPKYIVLDFIEEAKRAPIRLFDEPVPKSHLLKSNSIKDFGQYYAEGKKILENEIKSCDKEVIDWLVNAIYYIDRSNGYRKVNNSDIFSNECFVILVGQKIIDFKKLIKLYDEDCWRLNYLSNANIFSEAGIEILNKNYLSSEEIFDEKMRIDLSLSDFINYGGIALCEQGGFRIKDYLDLEQKDKTDIMNTLLIRGKHAIKRNLTNVHDFLKIPREQREEYIDKLNSQSTLEMKPTSPLEPSNTP